MSENDDHGGGGLVSGPPTTAALAAVPANDPVSASEVAEDLAVSAATAREALRELAADDELRHRRVKGRASALGVWYRPRPAEAVDLDARVDEALSGLAVPGASELMQSWRRDAVREAFEYLRDAGRATSAEIVDAVYSTHAANYDSEEAWWGMVAPRLGQLPGVATDDDGDSWQYTGES